MTIRRKSS